jgi:hypothetical protein
LAPDDRIEDYPRPPGDAPNQITAILIEKAAKSSSKDAPETERRDRAVFSDAKGKSIVWAGQLPVIIPGNRLRAQHGQRTIGEGLQMDSGYSR